jgi:hypothetical protein
MCAPHYTLNELKKMYVDFVEELEIWLEGGKVRTREMADFIE